MAILGLQGVRGGTGVTKLSSDNCWTIIQQLSDDNITIMGRIDLSKIEISL